MTESVETDPELATERTRLGGAGVLVAAVALVVFTGVQGPVAGLKGAVAAVVVLIAWYLFPPTYAFALGNVALVAVLPEAAVGRMVVVEAGLLGILLASATTLDEYDRRAHLALAVTALVLGWTLAGGALAWASAWGHLRLSVAGGLLMALFALAAYGLHRYQLVSLGIVGDASRGDTSE